MLWIFFVSGTLCFQAHFLGFIFNIFSYGFISVGGVCECRCLQKSEEDVESPGSRITQLLATDMGAGN